MSKEKALWFKRRRYGYGFTPVTKEGWIIVLGYLTFVLISAGIITYRDMNNLVTNLDIAIYLTIIFVLTAILIVISYKKGPTPRWRWGKSEDDDPALDW